MRRCRRAGSADKGISIDGRKTVGRKQYRRERMFTSAGGLFRTPTYSLWTMMEILRVRNLARKIGSGIDFVPSEGELIERASGTDTDP
jgi:hypothetical protein